MFGILTVYIRCNANNFLNTFFLIIQYFTDQLVMCHSNIVIP